MKLLSLLLFAAAAESTDIIANTKDGVVRGVQVHDHVNAFLGIPYAQPPVNSLRFEPPRPLDIPLGTAAAPSNATALGNACHQFMYRSVYGDSSRPSTPQSEDCLTSTYTFQRVLPPLKVPVTMAMTMTMTLAPPRSYPSKSGPTAEALEGAGSVPLYNPTSFVVENKDIIVVTWNYRTTIYGFPNSPALEHQNLGMRDQRLALEWVRESIAAFGGDPDRIVLGGQSAGAISAHAMSYAYRHDPIVTGFILQSGTIQGLGALAHHADFEFVRVAEAVGCLSDNRTEELQCMKTISADVLGRAISNKTLNAIGTPHGGWPMVDNVTVFTNEEYARRGEVGEFAQVPTIIGTMLNEGDAALNWDACTGVNKTASRITTETVFECRTAREAEVRALNNVPVWRYLYRGTFLDVETYPWLRTYHAAEIPILMGTYSLMGAKYASPQTNAASRLLQHLFGSFIRDPLRGLLDSYSLPIYQLNQSTLIELFPDNKPTFALATATVNAACANPTPIPPPDES